MNVRRIYQIVVGSLMLASASTALVAHAAKPATSREKVKVVAQDGSFTPSVIKAAAHTDVVLSIYAQDKDYSFIVPDVGVTTTIKKGSSVDIEIGSFGVGKHLFSCGSDCGGYIDLVLLRDEGE